MSSPTLVAVFFFFQIFGGQFGMALILGTVLFSKMNKHPLLVSFLASWMLYSAGFCLLLYTGHQFDEDKPLSLCIIQIAMVHGSTISTPLAGLTLLFNIWLNAQRLVQFGSTKDLKDEDDEEEDEVPFAVVGEKRWITNALVTVPYLAYFVVALNSIALYIRNSSLVGTTQETLYCSQNPNQNHVVPYIAAIILLFCVILEVLVVIKLLKFRKTSNWPKAQLATAALFRIFIRIGVFTAYAVLSLIAAIQFWFGLGKTRVFAHVIQALLPTAAFLIFGTQRDLLTAWGIIPLWKRISCRKPPISVRDEFSRPSSAEQGMQRPVFDPPRPMRFSTLTPPDRPSSYLMGAPRSFTPTFSSTITISEAHRG